MCAWESLIGPCNSCTRTLGGRIVGTKCSNYFGSIVVPPVMTDDFSTKKVTAEVGKNVTLRCNATGDPQPKLKWVKVGDSRRNISLGHMLHLTDFKKEDAGAYRCIANNGLKKEANATILVELSCEYY